MVSASLTPSKWFTGSEFLCEANSWAKNATSTVQKAVEAIEQMCRVYYSLPNHDSYVSRVLHIIVMVQEHIHAKETQTSNYSEYVFFAVWDQIAREIQNVLSDRLLPVPTRQTKLPNL